MVIEGDFVPGVVARRTRSRRSRGYNEFAFPSIDGSKPAVDGRRRHRRHVQGHAGGAAFDQLPGNAGGGDDLGEARRLLVAEQERARRARYQDPLNRATAIALARAQIFRFDMSDLQPASFGATAGQGEWKLFQDFLKNPSERQRHRGGARVGGGEGLQVEQNELARRHDGGASGHGGSAADSRRRLLARHVVAAAVPRCPRSIFLGVWIVYPAVKTVIRSFFDRTGTELRLVRQLQGDLHDPVDHDGDQEQRDLGRASSPRSSRRSGSIFAVLTERVRWAVAFKTAVFMPMAISLFAAGVIWRIMDQKEPSRGALNAGIAGGRTTRSARRARSPDALPSTDDADAVRPSRGSTLKTPCSPGSVALLGLTGIPPDAGAGGREAGGRARAGSSGIAGVVWRDFKPGGGTPGQGRAGRARDCPA